MPKLKPQPKNKLKVYTLEVGSLQTNCYLLVETSSKKTLIIDPGDDEEFIKNKIADNNLIPEGILATHGHFDHILAVSDLQIDFKIPFCLNQKDSFLIKKAKESASFFLKRKMEMVVPKVNINLENKPKIKVGNQVIEVIKVPGHTPGSIALYVKEGGLLFGGDLLFAGGLVGRTDFSYGDAQKLKKSLLSISKLPGEVMVYPGHGEPFLLKDFEFVP